MILNFSDKMEIEIGHIYKIRVWFFEPFLPILALNLAKSVHIRKTNLFFQKFDMGIMHIVIKVKTPKKFRVCILATSFSTDSKPHFGGKFFNHISTF
jgi:hypothetical protein